MLSIEVSNEQSAVEVDEQRLRKAASAILRDAGIGEASVSLAVVNDPTIHELNRQYLEHDYPTDVLSFLLEYEDSRLEGEVIVSGDTAVRTAERYGWAPADELLLYTIHGVLHLVGYDDQDPERRAEMRVRERHYLAQFGLQPHCADSDDDRAAE